MSSDFMNYFLRHDQVLTEVNSFKFSLTLQHFNSLTLNIYT